MARMPLIFYINNRNLSSWVKKVRLQHWLESIETLPVKFMGKVVVAFLIWVDTDILENLPTQILPIAAILLQACHETKGNHSNALCCKDKWDFYLATVILFYQQCLAATKQTRSGNSVRLKFNRPCSFSYLLLIQLLYPDCLRNTTTSTGEGKEKMELTSTERQ